MGELRRQLKPLEKQAELAAKHEELTKEAAGLAAGLAAVRLRELYRDRDRRRPTWAEAEARQIAAREHLDRLGREIEDVEKMLADREAAEREAESAHSGALATKSVAEAELREAIRDEAQARERLAAASNGAGRLFTLQDELARSEEAVTEVVTSLAERETALGVAEQEYRQLDQARRDAEDARHVAEGERAARLAQADALRRSLSLQQAEQQHLAETLQDVAGPHGGRGAARREPRGADRTARRRGDAARGGTEGAGRPPSGAGHGRRRAGGGRTDAAGAAGSRGRAHGGGPGDLPAPPSPARAAAGRWACFGS